MSSSKGPHSASFRWAIALAPALAAHALAPTSAHAGIYLTLRPVQSSLPAGSFVQGNDLAGYTLTLPAKAAQQTFQYDLVVRVTQGTGQAETGGRELSSLFGAVRTASAGNVTGNHAANPGTASQVPTYDSPSPTFQLDPANQLASSPQGINPFMIPSSLPGTNAPFNYGTGPNGTTFNGQPAPAVLGVGPQFNNFTRDPNFDNSVPQTTFQMSFFFGGNNGVSPYTVASNTAVVVARATVNMTSSDPSASATLSFVGGNGANGTSPLDAWATWIEEGTNYSTHNFSPGVTSALRQALSIQFDLLGDYNGNGIVDAADYTVWADHFGQNFPAADGNRNGIVDAADYTVWADNFGQGTPPGSAGAPIPEPAGLALALPALALLARRRR